MTSSSPNLHMPNTLDERMSIFTRWELGAKALALCKAAAALVSRIDLDAMLAVLLKIIELEREISTAGSGRVKVERLLAWFALSFPAYGDLETLRRFASAAVTLFNVLKLFRGKS